MTNLQVRKDANTSSTALYATKNISNFPVLIKATTTGQSIEGNNVWYRIQRDPTLNSNRSATTQGTYTYDFSKMYGYVSSQYVELVKYTNVSTNVPSDTPTTTVKKGDPSGDGKITSQDYIMIKNHILKIRILEGNAAKAADVNGDGKISSQDYIMIKNHILGIRTIK